MSATKTQETVRAEIIRTYNEGVDFHSAQGLLRERGSSFITNRQADAILNGSQLGEFRSAFPCWVGTGAFYEAPGKKFGGSVKYKFSNGQKIVVEVPMKFHGMKNTALALEHPEYTIEEKGSLWVFKINEPKKIQVIENFPRSDGWYIVHEATGIPIGKEVSSTEPNARYLYQQDNLAWLGPLARGVVYFWNVDRRRGVDACRRPDGALGVVGVGGREAAAPQNGVMINKVMLSPQEIKELRDECSVLVGAVQPELVDKFTKLLRRITQG